MTSVDKQQFGDFQTPSIFADKIIKLLVGKYQINPSVIIEPTMGEGSFILESMKSFRNIKKIFGIDISIDYIKSFESKYVECLNLVSLFHADIFNFDFGILLTEISRKDQILLIGNPPWITNSALSMISSCNLPYKDNFKKSKGIDAITGKSNFDIAEYILLELMSEFRTHHGTMLAFLCKNTVAKNIVRDLHKYNFTLDIIDVYEFSAKDVFNVATDAVLFVTRIGDKNSQQFANVFSIDNPNEMICKYGWIGKSFISNLDKYSKYSFIDGTCQMIWRQGVKHDASKVMEFHKTNGELTNGYGEKVTFYDSDYLYPLAKSSMLKKPILNSNFRYVLVTQKKVGENTDVIAIKDKKVWSYLLSHKSDFEKRKSVIYSKAPGFAMFGVGDYSFSHYKVAISGFYKEPKFSLLYSAKPVMLDDTCYFLSFDNKEEALIILALLNHRMTCGFLESISFVNSKRPYTKEILQRIDLQSLARCIKVGEIIEYLSKIDSSVFLDEKRVYSILKKQFEK